MILEHDGVAMSHVEWGAEFGIPPRLILGRLDCGWPVAQAIETPMEAPPGFKLGDLKPRRKRPSGPGRSTTVFIEHDGLRLSLTEWSERLGITRTTISGRLRRGLPPADVLSTSRLGKERGPGGSKQLSPLCKKTGAPVTRKIAPN